MAELSQLKSSSITIDTDDPTSSWVKVEKAIEAWVRSLKGGCDICDFLDFFYGRAIAARNSSLVPSFLNGGAWSTGATPSKEEVTEEELSPLRRRGAVSGLISPARTIEPLYRINAYAELSHDSKQLDLSLALAALPKIYRARFKSCSFGPFGPAAVYARYGDASPSSRGG